jgi:YVTN family beta-propeller protein
VAIIDIQSLRVSTEVAVGYGPSYVAMAGSTALVVNQDEDSVSLVDIFTYKVRTVSVGRGPRGIAEDFDAAKVYVTNEDDGTITVIDLNNLANPTTTISLPPNARPSGIQLLSALNLAIVTDSVASSNGEVFVLNLANGTTGTVLVNPGRNGGATGVASYANTVYFANQGGGSVTATKYTAGGGSTSVTVKTDLGARALAVDTVDSLVLVANEGSGTVTLIDLVTNQVKGGINALRSPNEIGGVAPDNHNDRITAQNAPTIASMTHSSLTPLAGGGWSFTITINGTNLQQADALYFMVPSSLPAQSNGYVHTAGDEHLHGPYGTIDTHMTASSIVANQAGIQLTATITISPTGLRGVPRVVRVEAPNGNSSFTASSINTIVAN